MAQANFTPIQLYRSTTASAAPAAGNLADGELAINTNDEKLYFKNSGGTVKLLASSAGASGNVVGPASATDNAVVRFDGTTGKLVQNSVVTIADSTGDVAGVGALTTTPAANGNTVFNENGVDSDFRVESDTNTHAFFVDAGNNQVVIGGSAAVTGSSNQIPLVVRYASGPAVRFYSNESATQAATSGLSLQTYGDYKYTGYEVTSNGNGIWGSSSNGTMTWVTAASSGTVNIGAFNQSPFSNTSATFTNYATFNNSEIVFNDDSRDADFRVESDTNTHALFMDAGNSTVGVNTSSVGATFNVQGTATKLNSQQFGDGADQGTSQFNRVVKLCPSVSSNNKLIIPFASQGNLNSTTVCRVMGHNAGYNTSTPYGFEITFAVGHLNAMYSLSYWGVGGNAVSAAINGQTVEITFTTAYNVQYGVSGGVFVTLEYMTNVTNYSIDIANVRLN